MVVQLAGGNFLPCSNLMAFMLCPGTPSQWYGTLSRHPRVVQVIETSRQPTQVAWQADWARDRKTELGKSFSYSCPFSVPLTDFCTSQVRLLNKGYCVLDGVLEDVQNLWVVSPRCLTKLELVICFSPAHAWKVLAFIFRCNRIFHCDAATTSRPLTNPLRDGSSVLYIESALSIIKQRWWYLYPVSCWC